MVGGISEVTSGPQMTPLISKRFLKTCDRKKKNNLLWLWDHATSIITLVMVVKIYHNKPQRCSQLCINSGKM